MSIRIIAAGWNAGYAAVHVWWAVAGAPHFASFGESFIPGSWTPVVVSVLAVAACLLPDRAAAVGLGWVAGIGMILYSFMFGLDLAGMLFGESTDWPGFLIRTAGVVGGVLVVRCTLKKQRAVRHACPACGRLHGRSPERRTDHLPRWAFAAGYLAVAGSLARLGAELATGFAWPLSELTSIVFLTAYGMAGVLLPLALTHRWGRIWPRWVVPLAGRNVPRWLVAGPALLVGSGLTGYFGVVGMTYLIALGVDPGKPFWWTLAVIPGYTVWGLGLVVAAVPYLSITKAPCPAQRNLNKDSTPLLA